MLACLLIAALTVPSWASAAEGEEKTGTEVCNIGDADGDGKITVADARTALRTAIGLTETEEVKKEEDADLDGEVTVEDARFILRVSIGLDSFYLAGGDKYKADVASDGENTHTVKFTVGETEYSVTERCRRLTDSETPPTCVKDGVRVRKCDVCGSSDRVTLKATGHNFEGPAIKTGKGTHYYECANGCGEKTKETACEYTSAVLTPARCGIKGSTIYTCGVCGYYYTELNIPALTHSFTDYKPDGNATWLKDGTKTAHCDNEGCEKTDTKDDPGSKLNTSYIPENVKVLYLTFDDGPSKYTKKIIDILDAHGAKATWFVIHTDAYSSGYKAIVDSGNAIALHSYTHDYSKIYRSTSGFYSDLNRISDEVFRYTGVRTKLYRFPGGSSNTVSRSYCRGIMSELTKSVEKNGYVYFDWNAANNDATGQNLSVNQIYRAAISGCGPNRVVMLMHDTNAKYNTVAALGDIIDYYKARGYYCLALDEYSPTTHHRVAN